MECVIILNVRSDSMRKEINSELVAYIETEFFPIYETFDKGHDLKHIKEVIDRALKIVDSIDGLDIDIVYAAASLHDIGIQQQRKNHAFYSGLIVQNNEGLRNFFDCDEIRIIKEAVEDHSTSLGREPRSIYGKIVCDADKDNDLETSLTRAYEFTLAYFPDFNQEECLENVFEQLNFKFGNEGKVHFWIGTEEQQKFLNQMRSLANDKEAFLTTMEPIVEKCGKAEKVKCINS